MNAWPYLLAFGWVIVGMAAVAHRAETNPAGFSGHLAHVLDLFDPEPTCIQCMSPNIEHIEVRHNPGGSTSRFAHCNDCGHCEPRGQRASR